MTYGFRPENWPAFQAELQRRDIRAADIEKVEMRPTGDPGAALARTIRERTHQRPRRLQRAPG
jgi:hypothetical protein